MVEKKLVKRAVEGDRSAAAEIIGSVKDLVYNLSLKMLLFPEDAEDASQEILLKVLTRLSGFRFQSDLHTWVYRIAINTLLTYRGKLSKRFETGFDEYEQLIDSGQRDSSLEEQEARILAEEVRISCTHGLLLCLSPKSRAVFILSDILDFDSIEGSVIVGVSPTAFRKSLSRSRKKLRDFLERKCGLIDEKNPCRCSNKIDFLSENELTDPRKLRFSKHSGATIAAFRKIEKANRFAQIYRSVDPADYPGDAANELMHVLGIAR